MEDFVGADDAGSSTALMLELARLLCPQRGKYAVWIAFFDGEEAMKHWSDTDSRYGSRQMAARLSTSGDIKKIRAFLLADIVGGRNAQFLRESSSTPVLIDLVWNTAARLGYSAIFRNDATSAEDDHDSFLKRGVPAVDVIGGLCQQRLLAHSAGCSRQNQPEDARHRRPRLSRVREATPIQVVAYPPPSWRQHPAGVLPLRGRKPLAEVYPRRNRLNSCVTLKMSAK